MSLGYFPQYTKRFYYQRGGSEVYKLPANNLFSAVNLLLQLQVNIVTNPGSNVPDNQIFRAIERLELIRDTKTTVWSISGEKLQAIFGTQYGNGAVAPENATIPGTVANDVRGQHYAHIPAWPLGTLKPNDFAIDTRRHDYELKIKWRDLTVAGTLFGTLGGTITVVDSENYLELELDTIEPQVNPATGMPDGLAKTVPLVVGIREENLTVDSSNTKFQIDIPEFMKFRNIILFTDHAANTAQIVGENDIIQNMVKLYDTQQKTYQSMRADMLRAKTGRRWGRGASIPNGMYDIHMAAFGSAFDALASSNVRDLYLDLDVVKQANATYIVPVYVTQEDQGV
ncbi:MAG: hypothetical protein KJ667_01705 [Alphaproteobacteria bacterium]|nr:hypothetical protein [Alphaproteobacteria bacterium]